ncbi:MAG: O-antigen ligase family protein [Marmoricola sp.]
MSAADAVVVGVGVVVLTLLVLLSTRSLVLAGVCIGVAGLALALAVLGSRRLGTLAVLGAFATVPMYKGLAVAGPITVPDALFVLGFGLLAFELLRGRPRAPLAYFVGVGLVCLSGIMAALLNSPSKTLPALSFWLITIFVLPMAIAAWHPAPRVLDALAWAYVIGQVVDTGYAAIHDGTQGLRWYGLSTQPNYLGQCGLLAICLLMFLHHRVRPNHRWIVWAAGAVCAAGVFFSGSRAAAVVLAVIILLVPLVERTGRSVTFAAVCGALGVLAGGFLLGTSGSSSTSVLGRFTGGGTAQGSDQMREQGLSNGWHQFLSNPIGGHGLSTNELFLIHNNLLEILVGVGIFGLAGYLLVLWTLGRIVLTELPLRRLGYAVIAYLGFGLTVPALYDRSIWAVVGLALLAYQKPQPQAILAADRRSPAREPIQKVVA